MTSDELLKIELPSLRDEMLEVKKCQHQMFIFEIVGTGAILGFILPFISTILEKIHFWPVLFLLSPLVIIIPSQYLILDKAITINRICSYIKILEERIGYQKPVNFFAWETGCAKFRGRSGELKPAASQNGTQGPNRFYWLCFITTAIITGMLLSLMAVFYAILANTKGVNSTEIVILAVLSIAVVLTLVHQSIWLSRVLEGKFTILAMADLWQDIL
jgi:hypothetical protein